MPAFEDDSFVTGREACPKCGSRDNVARYSDGHAKCFSQGCKFFQPAPHLMNNDNDDDDGDEPYVPDHARRQTSELIDGDYTDLAKRRLTVETCRRYGYQVGKFKGGPVQIANYRDSSGVVVAQKLRFADKEKGMPWRGDARSSVLFGQHLAGGGKRIVITEGELDAMTVSQVQGNKWPVVSVINGAASAARDILKQIDFVTSFDEVVLMFDMDDAGRAAMAEVAEALPNGLCKIAELPFKDASECLQNGAADVIVPAIWNARPYLPASVVAGAAVIERMKNRPAVVSFPYPDYMPEFTRKVLGLRMSELTTWTSGSGMGKTTKIKQLQIHYFQTTDFNQAIIHLEEPLEDTADTLTGIFMGKRLELPEVADTVPREDVIAEAEKLFLAQDPEGNHRFYLHDAFGSMGDDDQIMNRIRYYATVHNCKIIWLDHLSILVSDMGEEGDERRRIDGLMHKLAQLAVELKISINLISHLKKAPQGKSFEEGYVPSLDDLRGSGGIKQLSMNVYALSRNQQAETEQERNTTQVHVLKCRRTGDTGGADFIAYNRLTGRFEPGLDPEFLSKFGGGDDVDDPKPPKPPAPDTYDDIPF